MLIRKCFITNSSSTSFTAYGIEIHEYTRMDVVKCVLDNWPDIKERFAKEYVDTDDVEEWEKDPIQWIDDNGWMWDFMYEWLPGGLYVEDPGDYIFYICMGKPRLILNDDGSFTLPDPNELKGAYQELKKLIGFLKLNKSIGIVSDSWYS